MKKHTLLTAIIAGLTVSSFANAQEPVSFKANSASNEFQQTVEKPTTPKNKQDNAVQKNNPLKEEVKTKTSNNAKTGATLEKAQLLFSSEESINDGKKRSALEEEKRLLDVEIEVLERRNQKEELLKGSQLVRLQEENEALKSSVEELKTKIAELNLEKEALEDARDSQAIVAGQVVNGNQATNPFNAYFNAQAQAQAQNNTQVSNQINQTAPVPPVMNQNLTSTATTTKQKTISTQSTSIDMVVTSIVGMGDRMKAKVILDGSIYTSIEEGERVRGFVVTNIYQDAVLLRHEKKGFVKRLYVSSLY